MAKGTRLEEGTLNAPSLLYRDRIQAVKKIKIPKAIFAIGYEAREKLLVSVGSNMPRFPSCQGLFSISTRLKVQRLTLSDCLCIKLDRYYISLPHLLAIDRDD